MDTNQNSLSNALLQSIDLMAKKQANSVPNTLVVEAQIVEAVDEGTGVYKVKYMNNTFEAVAASNEIIYHIDEIVYIVVPNGNFDNNKIILAPVYAEDADYSSTDTSKFVTPIGKSLIGSVATELCTYHDESKQIYTGNFGQLFNDCLQDSRTFNLTCKIKTSIDKDRRLNGNYGLVLTIPVLQENKPTNYTFTMDINNILGDAYGFSEYALQNCYFELPEDMEYDTTKSGTLTAFVNGFPQGQITKPDIWIEDIQLVSTLSLNKNQIQGYYLVLKATGGNSFNNSEEIKKTISPIVLLNGRTTQVSNFNCYWFRENNLVDTTNDKYHKLGGLGWEILNDKTNIEIREDGKETFQYVTNVYSLDILQNDIPAYTRYKCVLTKGEQVITQFITIRNLNASVEINLESVTGSNIYTKNVGKIRLRVSYYDEAVTDQADIVDSIGYAWKRFDKDGNYLGDDFFTIDKINEKKDKWVETEISYDTSLVDEVNTITCTVYTEKDAVRNIKGTRSIMITTSEITSYRIRVDNGDKLFKYDADGDSPLVADYDGPISSALKEITPISVSLYKPDGNEFTDDEYAATQLIWRVPVNSMVVLNQDLPQPINGYYEIPAQNSRTLSYSIRPVFDRNRSDNTIFIKAIFRNNIFEQGIPLQFLKDGEAGVNGSRFSGVITYGAPLDSHAYGEKNSDGLSYKFQLIYVDSSQKWYYYNPASGQNPARMTNGIDENLRKLNLQLYCDGEIYTKDSGTSITWKIFEGDFLEKYKEASPSTVNNNYVCPINISNEGVITLKSNIKWDDNSKNYLAVIEASCMCYRSSSDSGTTGKAEYVYAYYPIEMTWVPNANYLKGLVPTIEGGFSTVTYASDGTNPKYNTSEGFRIADSLHNEKVEELYNYIWSVPSITNIIIRSGANTNNCKAIPTNKYDNGIAQNMIKVSLTSGGLKRTELARRKTETYDQLTEVTKRLNYYQRLQGSSYAASPLHILQEFDYNSYLIRFRELSKFYQVKTELVNIDKKLANMLDALIALGNKYDATVAAQAGDRKGRADNLFTLIYALGVTANNNSSRIKSEYQPESFIFDITSTNVTIKDNLKKFNNQINTTYQNVFNKLDSISDNEIVAYNIAQSLRAYTNDGRWEILIGESIDGIKEQQYIYKPLLDNLKEYINKLAGDSTYNYDGVVNNVLKPMNDAIAAVKDTTYADLISSLNTQKTTLTAQYNEYNNFILPADREQIIHIKPIIMVYNRYEMSNINGWDGNKLVLNHEEGYILTPQLGAGKKENDNSFTGVVIGVKQNTIKNYSNDQKIGLLGYTHGIQSIFLNAEDGSAFFGTSGGGQIQLIPGSTATIQSGNYEEKGEARYDEVYLLADSNPKEQGLYEIKNNDYVLTQDTSPKPNKRYYRKAQYSGMRIDLTTPEIKFGSGKFSVNSAGKLEAKDVKVDGEIIADSGTIGDWIIGKDETTGKGFLVGSYTDTSTSKIYKTVLNSDGSMYGGLQEGTLIPAWSMSGTGHFTAHDATIEGTVTATSGEIGGWVINENTLKGSYKPQGSSKTYETVLNADGSMHGGLKGSSSYSWNISNTGELFATGATFTSADLSGKITAIEGKIGGWIIGANILKGGNIILNSEGSMSGGSGDSTWEMTEDGKFKATNAELTGKIIATEGEIGGWIIEDPSEGYQYGRLVSKAITRGKHLAGLVGSNGHIFCNGFSVDDVNRNTIFSVLNTTTNSSFIELGGTGNGNTTEHIDLNAVNRINLKSKNIILESTNAITIQGTAIELKGGTILRDHLLIQPENLIFVDNEMEPLAASFDHYITSHFKVSGENIVVRS